MNTAKVKVLNTETGRYLVIGKGFVTDCYWEASELSKKISDIMCKVMGNKYTTVKSLNEFECGCDECEGQRQ